jgi:photosystem II stability/assembly factor-like uncharacterized protein
MTIRRFVRWPLASFFALLAVGPAHPVAAVDKPAWVSISQDVTSRVKPGYPGKTAGVTVDPSNGDLYMVVPDQGLWKSTDHGKSFARVDNSAIGGRCETGFALDFDPGGKRLMCFMIYGGSALTPDSGKTWLASKSSHLDFGGVDWERDGTHMLALRHESAGQLCYSADQGQTWSNLEKGFVSLGMFDGQTLIASKGKGLLRSDDSGKNWTSVSEIEPAGRVMRVFKGTGYWATDRGLLVSKDLGKTWKIDGAAVNAVFGPYWGKAADDMVVVGKQGFHETLDGGKTWHLAAPLPPEFGVGMVGPNYAWDPHGDIFYASSMGKDTFKFERPRK